MSTSKSQRQRQSLGDDGELHDEAAILPEEIVAQTSPVYCIHCGSVNRSEARFCRRCGQALDDQDVDPALAASIAAPGLRKRKYAADMAPEPASRPAFASLMTSSMAALQVFVIIAVALMVIFAVLAGSPLIAVVVLIAWFMVEAAWAGALK